MPPKLLNCSYFEILCHFVFTYLVILSFFVVVYFYFDVTGNFISYACVILQIICRFVVICECYVIMSFLVAAIWMLLELDKYLVVVGIVCFRTLAVLKILRLV